MMKSPLHILCISRFFKGSDFIIAAKATGNKVYLLSSTQLQNEAWPWDAIEDSFFLDEDDRGKWNREHLLNGLAYKMRDLRFDVLVALDDFDVEMTAFLREHFRIAGMGETTCRFFRDKLAMRMKAAEADIPIPAFTALFHDEDIHQFCRKAKPPWLLKPRTAASAMGIVKCHNEEELWNKINELGDDRHRYLLEQFAPGDVFHVDALSFDGKVLFARASRYLDTPMAVAQGGGIFRSQTLALQSSDHKKILALNKKLLKHFGLQYGASHTEFIKNHENGTFYFLETASRVGGAHLAEMVEAASGVNLWKEWAKLEAAQASGKKYKVPKDKNNHAGIVVSLCRFEQPDYSSFRDKEIVWKLHKAHHIGMIVHAKKEKRIRDLLDLYAERIAKDFHASVQPEEIWRGGGD